MAIHTTQPRKKLAALLVDARKRKGWTQQEMAEKMGMTAKTYRSLETGTHPVLKELFKAARLLDVKIEGK